MKHVNDLQQNAIIWLIIAVGLIIAGVESIAPIVAVIIANVYIATGRILKELKVNLEVK